MIDRTPDEKEMIKLVGKPLYDVYSGLCRLIDEHYDVDHLWNSGKKAWTYEYKYRRGGKTLCAFYAKENCIGFMIIFGKDEREIFENNRASYSNEAQKIYDDAKVFHDGKWVMFELQDNAMFDDFIKLLSIKRKPNRKQ